MSEYRKFLVPYDFSSHARVALKTALDLARRLGADLHLVHVIHIPPYVYHGGVYGEAPPPIDTSSMRDAAARSLAEIANEVSSGPCKVELHVVEGAGVAEALQRAAEDLGADLIVMGRSERFMHLGSTAVRVLRNTDCALLIVPPSASAQTIGVERPLHTLAA